MDLRVLFIGDLVGTPGLQIVKERLAELRQHLAADLVIANVENVANGSGVTRALGADILKTGVDLMTMGDHSYGKRDHVGYLDKEPKIIRPLNYPKRANGKGLIFHDLEDGRTVALFQVQGRVFLPPTACPFEAAEEAAALAQARTPFAICDMHCEATSEKIALGWFLDGKVSGLFGTHTHVQTADEQILPNGTAYISDVGMTGPYDSVIGRDKSPVLKKFLTNVPAFFSVATGDVRLSGVFCVFDGEGAAKSIERVHLKADAPVESALTGKRSHG